jgi:ubiquitin carboxyl-terminal hydrolase 25/28
LAHIWNNVNVPKSGKTRRADRCLASGGDLPETLRQMRELDSDWKILGLTPSSYTPGIIAILRTNTFLLKFRVELLTFAYLAQCRCDPTGTVDYLAALEHIVQAMQVMNEDTPADLQTLVLEERMRFMRDDFLKAVSRLDIGPDRPLGVDFDESVEEQFIINAWRDGVGRSWDDETNGSVTRREPNDALRVIADVGRGEEMRRVWECERGCIMTVGTAYSTLGVSRNADESTIITVPDVLVSETLSRGFLTTHISKG